MYKYSLLLKEWLSHIVWLIGFIRRIKKMMDDLSYKISKKRYKMPIRHGGREAYLTKRETIIVALLIKGMRAKQIAWELHSSLHTINTHLSNIKEKLNCDNIFQLGLILGDYKTQLESIDVYEKG